MLKWIRRDDKQYYIYTLVDPRNDLVRYVGISNDADLRYQQHLRGRSNKYVWQWIKELEKLSINPVMHILETVDRDTDISFRDFMVIVSRQEAYWIQKYSSASLLNIIGVNTRYPKVNDDKSNLNKKNSVANSIKNEGPVSTSQTVISVVVNHMRLEDFRIDIAVLTRQGLATLADVSISSIQRAEEGKGISRLTQARILKGLSKHLGRVVKRDEVDEFKE